MSKKKAVTGSLLGGIALVFLAIILFVHLFLASNVKHDATIEIKKEVTYEQFIELLDKKDVLKHDGTFRLNCKWLCKKMRPGKYQFKTGESNFSLMKMLRRGQHFPVKVTFTGVRTKDDLLKKFKKCKFLFEWEDFAKLLEDKDFLKTYQPFGDVLAPNNVIAIFRPNSYELYYDITAKDFFDKMYEQYRKFWTEERLKKAESIGLTPMEVCTLASIVEEENHNAKEQPRIAGLYMNRLHKDMPLQADPTVIFAIGDYAIKRVLQQHTQVDSRYNTYKYKGLPPGPIRLPSDEAIDAVLNYERHNFIYMCAKEDFSGMHNFTDNYTEHLKNARKFQAELNKRKM